LLTTLTSLSLSPGLGDTTWRITCAQLYSHLGEYDKALLYVHDLSSLEGHALCVQLYLGMHRPDHAAKELKKLQEKDDMSTLTQLAHVWINLAGNEEEKMEEALVIYTELIQKWGATPLLLNGLAVCHLKKLYSKNETKLSEKELLLALEKDSNDANTLANLIVTQLLLGKDFDQVQRVINKLKTVTKTHPLISNLETAESNFDTFAAKYKK